MAEANPDAGAPNLNLTPEEKRVYGLLFRQADTDSVGVVTGDVAVKFFDKTRLDSRILGEIWQIADRENRGFLTPSGFGIVLRLIGHAQAGREPAPEVALQPGPLPRFDGIVIPGLAPQPTGAGPVPGPLQAQASGGVRIPPLTPEKAAQFAGLFEQQPLAPGNMLPGDQARQIFERSGLPTEVLGRIWQLADTEQRGALVQTEFIIAMHLLATTKQGHLRALPTVVPAGLYEAATRRPTGIPRQQSPIPAVPPIPAIPRQLSGQAAMRTGSPLGRSHPAPSGGDWLVTPADKARFDLEYAKLDKTSRGFITGEEAVPFFSQSRLPEDTLAQIWDLADLTSQGRLTRDEFAVAMYLIRQQRTNRDGANTLPTTLPQNLIPPSMRAQVRPPTATGSSSAFDAPLQPPPAPQPKSALDDLFGLDSPPQMPVAPVQKAVTTGGSNDPFGSNASPAPASPAKPSPTASSFAPFVPSSSFGRTLTAQATGASSSSAGGMRGSGTLPPPPAAQDDLLGAQDEASNNVSNDTAELANLSNQITSLSKHVQDVRGQQATTQNELTQTNAQKKNFEQRLSQLRAAYEKEAKDVRALEEQLNASRADTKKLQTEMAMLDGTYQDLQNQHRQVAAALQADQQENAGLKERIRVVNAEVAQLKPQIEKLRSEARQQKGLVAINKKQLATNEGERDKLKAEIEDLAKSNEDLARQAHTGSPVVPPAQVASPAPSAASGNNPFFRRTGSTDIMGAFASPPAKPFDKSFDDVFGPSPSFPASTGTPPPATAFGPQHTGASTGSAASSFATPATSTTPNISRQATLGPNPIPPPPPQSRQISSSFLPFGEAAESMSSSRQVSPPVSRMGQPETPLAEAGARATAAAAAALEPTATGQSFTSESHVPGDNRPTSSGSSVPKHADAASAPAQGRVHADSVSDPFAAVDQAKAKDDFESAFASFKTAHGKPLGGASSVASGGAGSETSKGAFADAFSREFPPISELERDDYSDSDTDKDGFDDDFAPVSPPANPAQPAKPSEATAAKPPAAEGATRETAPSPTAATSSSSISTAMPAGPANVDSIWGDSFTASSSAAPATAQSGQPESGAAAPHPLPAKKSFDDLDDEFEGLEDAKEGSTADDDFANISRSALDDFNPVFDSSPPRSHAAKSDGGSNNLTAGAAPNFTAESSSFDFVSGSSASLGSGSGVGANTSSGGASAQPAGPPPAGGAAENHDWDALFAGLEEPQAASGVAAAARPGAVAAPAAANGAVASPGSPPPASTASPPPPVAPVPSRPAVAGRLLTEEGEHDDPILKNLTSMGYARGDALSALEKYDYNLERAANYLASQS